MQSMVLSRESISSVYAVGT